MISLLFPRLWRAAVHWSDELLTSFCCNWGLARQQKFIPLVTLAHPPPPPQPENGYSMTSTLTTAAQSDWKCGLCYTPHKPLLYMQCTYTSCVSLDPTGKDTHWFHWHSHNRWVLNVLETAEIPGLAVLADYIYGLQTIYTAFTHTQLSSCPKPSLLCLTKDSANHILFTAAKEWTFLMLGSPANNTLEDVLARGKASTCTWLTRGGHLGESAHCTRTSEPNTSVHRYTCFHTVLLAAGRGKKLIKI